jgi:signal transduction histidine kinase
LYVHPEDRDAVLASVCHDLRTPLTAVQGYSQLLKEDWASQNVEEREEMLEIVQDQATHLGRLVTDILDVTRDRAPGAVLDLRPCAADRLLARAAASLPPAQAASVDLRAAPGLLILADAGRIHQVLVNLLTNALRYGRTPVLATADRRGDQILIQVHDAGAGVPRRYEAAIWQRFERGAFRREATAGSLGLGLPIAKALVEAHGGAIGYRRSPLLGGACFEFTLPAAPEPPPPGGASREDTAELTGAGIASPA